MPKQKAKKKPKKRNSYNWGQFVLVATVCMLSGGLAAFIAHDYIHGTASSANTPTIQVDRPATAHLPGATKHQAVSNLPAPVAKPVHDYVIPPVTDGAAPLLTHIPTKQPVVFLGIDDGGTRNAAEISLMRDEGVVASLFLSDSFIKSDRNFFKGFVAIGSLVEDHSVDHHLMAGMDYEQQKAEICDQADTFAKIYGRRPVLFRPPGGDYDYNTLVAAADCGMKAVVNWIAKANGGSMQYQIGHSLQPGDIVLMHFRPEFKQDMQAFLDAIHASGLHTELLENWLSQDGADSSTNGNTTVSLPAATVPTSRE